MHTVEVDFDVLKALMTRREVESVTYNDVIRRLIGLDKTAVGNRPEVESCAVGGGGGGRC